MKNFDALGLPEPLRHTLAHMKFDTPTPIQAQAIPPALEGKDILGSAQTGTGKTGAFGIPLVTQLLTTPRGGALVMTPTRELATQVMTALQAFLGKRSPIKTALLIGGESMPKQLQQLRQRPRLIVGTPGRINDHLTRGSLMLFDTNFLVLDETDRMLDMGFTVQIEKIVKFLPPQRQTLLFSATLPKNIMQISQKYLTNPVRVAVDAADSAAKNIKQEMIRVDDGEKYGKLLEELDKREGSIIVFVKTKHGADKMAVKLRKQGHKAEAIHGDLHQNKRDRVIANFRISKYRILVATDVAARGLDIPHIEHVINYDLPHNPEDYIHRIGRTARAGAEGSALCFVTPKDRASWKAIERMLDPNAKQDKDDGGGDGPNKSSKRHYGPNKGKGKSSNFKRRGGNNANRGRRGEGQGQGSKRPEKSAA
jgi:superfamily II DNA/RNA helicase